MPNRRAQRERAKRKKSSTLHGFQNLPNEVVLEIMKLASQNVHASLLSTCKSFYQLGRSSLYRSLWIISPYAFTRLGSTFEANENLATHVRTLKMTFSGTAFSQFDVRISLLGFEQTLRSMCNLEDLQLYLEEYQYLIFMYPSTTFASLELPRLKSFSILMCDIFYSSYHLVLELLRKHPHIQHLSILRKPPFSPLDFHYSGTKNIEPFDLPALRSYQGPMSIFKHFVSNVPSLSSLVLDITHDDPGEIIPQLVLLNGLEKRWAKTDSELSSPRLSVDLLVSLGDHPFSQLLETAIIHLPKDLQNLTIRCTTLFSEPDLMHASCMADLSGVTLSNFPKLRKFGVLFAMHSVNKVLSSGGQSDGKFWEAALQAVKAIGSDCPSLEEITLCGCVYQRSMSKEDEWLDTRTGEVV